MIFKNYYLKFFACKLKDIDQLIQATYRQHYYLLCDFIFLIIICIV
jgi:hypothetical protein